MRQAWDVGLRNTWPAVAHGDRDPGRRVHGFDADVSIPGGVANRVAKHVLDRTTGEVLSATPFHAITSSKGVDLKTGKLITVAAKHPVQKRVVRNICPGPAGGKDWNPSAFSPVTGLLYVPTLNICMDMGVVNANYSRDHCRVATLTGSRS